MCSKIECTEAAIYAVSNYIIFILYYTYCCRVVYRCMYTQRSHRGIRGAAPEWDETRFECVRTQRIAFIITGLSCVR